MSGGLLLTNPDGEEFKIDFVEDFEVDTPVGVPKHTVEGGGDLGNHVQINPTIIRVTARHSEHPEDPIKGDSTTGEQRLVACVAWLRDNLGKPLDLKLPRMPAYRGFMVSAFPQSFNHVRDVGLPLIFEQYLTASSKTAILPSIARGNPSEDVGDIPSEEAGEFQDDDVSNPRRFVNAILGLG